jgi:hypothetical protein
LQLTYARELAQRIPAERLAAWMGTSQAALLMAAAFVLISACVADFVPVVAVLTGLVVVICVGSYPVVMFCLWRHLRRVADVARAVTEVG